MSTPGRGEATGAVRGEATGGPASLVPGDDGGLGCAESASDRTARQVVDLVGALRPFVRSTLARSLAVAPVLRRVVGDAGDATEDVLADVAVVLWAKRDVWLTRLEPRAWAFGVARVQVARYLDAARAQMRLLDHLEPDAAGHPDEAGTEGTDPGGDGQWAQVQAAWARLRAVVVDRVGAGVWDKVVAAAAVPTGERGHLVRARVREAVEAVIAGRGVDIAAVVSAAGSEIETWAAGQAATGRTLDPARAVRDGVASSPLRARRALALWWARDRSLSGQDITWQAVVAAGLVDETCPSERADAARRLLGWLSWAHPDLVSRRAGGGA